MEAKGKIWDSVTNVVLLMFVIQLPLLIWFDKVGGDLFKDSFLLILGYFFVKKGVESGVEKSGARPTDGAPYPSTHDGSELRAG